MNKKQAFISLLLVFVLAFSAACAAPAPPPPPAAPAPPPPPPVVEKKVVPQDLVVKLLSVSTKVGAEQILSDNLLIARAYEKEAAKAGWLTLLGMVEGKMAPVAIPANVLLATVPKMDLTLVFEITNPNDFAVTLASMDLGVVEETTVGWSTESIATVVMMPIAPRGKTTVEVLYVLLRISPYTAMGWPAVEKAMETGARWYALGTLIVLSEKVAGGGWRHLYRTAPVVSTPAG